MNYLRAPFDIARAMVAIVLCIVSCALVLAGAAALYAAKIVDSEKVSDGES